MIFTAEARRPQRKITSEIEELLTAFFFFCCFLSVLCVSAVNILSLLSFPERVHARQSV
jgi:hypothetical protein